MQANFAQILQARKLLLLHPPGSFPIYFSWTCTTSTKFEMETGIATFTMTNLSDSTCNLLINAVNQSPKSRESQRKRRLRTSNWTKWTYAALNWYKIRAKTILDCSRVTRTGGKWRPGTSYSLTTTSRRNIPLQNKNRSFSWVKLKWNRSPKTIKCPSTMKLRPKERKTAKTK